MDSISRIWLLIRLLWKTGGTKGLELQGGLFGKTGKKRKSRFAQSKFVQIVLLLLFVAYMAGIMVISTSAQAPVLIKLGQDRLLFELYMPIFAMLTISFGFFYTFSTLAFSDDQERLTAMPFKRGEILVARMILLAVNQLFFLLIIGVPVFFTYGYYKGLDVLFYLKVVLAMLLQTLVPVGLMVILCIALIRLTPLAKNRDRFTIVSQVILSLVFFYIFFGMSNLVNPPQNGEAAQLVAGSQANPLYSVMRYLIPNLDGLIDFMLLNGVAAALALLKVLLISLVFLLLAYFIANKFYYPQTRVTATRKKLSQSKQTRVLQKKSGFRALLARDAKQVFRNPTILMNNVIGNLMFIIMIVVISFFGLRESGAKINLEQVRTAIHGFSEVPGFDVNIVIVCACLVSALLAHFFLGVSTLSASAVSRQGEEIYWSILLPVSLKTQYLAKTTLSVLLSLIPYLIFFLVLVFVLALPLQWVILPFLIFIWSGINANLLPLLWDAMNPVLDWENEIYAIKSNKNVLFSMLSSWIFAGLCGLMLYLMFAKDLAPWYLFATLILLLVLETFISIICVPKALQKTYHHIEDYL